MVWLQSTWMPLDNWYNYQAIILPIQVLRNFYNLCLFQVFFLKPYLLPKHLKYTLKTEYLYLYQCYWLCSQWPLALRRNICFYKLGSFEDLMFWKIQEVYYLQGAPNFHFRYISILNFLNLLTGKEAIFEVWRYQSHELFWFHHSLLQSLVKVKCSKVCHCLANI